MAIQSRSWNLSPAKPQTKLDRAKLIGSVIVGSGTIIAIIGLFVVFVIVPAVNYGHIKNHLNLHDERSVGRQLFEDPQGGSFLRFFFFRLENSIQIFNGDKPEVVQRGPYTFKYERRNTNLTHDPVQGGFSVKRSFHYQFDPENSCQVCQDSDQILFVNIPLLTLVHLARTDARFPRNVIHELNQAIQTNGSHFDGFISFIRVGDFLFRGWNPPVLKWFRSAYPELWQYMPDKFHPEGFAFQSESNISDFYLIGDGGSKLEDIFQIKQWGPNPSEVYADLTPTHWWAPNGGFEGSNACNWLKGTDGFQFSPFVAEGGTLWIFQRDMCRSVELVPIGEGEVREVPVVRYTISNHSLIFNTKTNLGFCMEAEVTTNWSACVRKKPNSDQLDVQECLMEPGYHGYCHEAVWDVTTCMRGIPMAISFPHFYLAPNVLRTNVKGLSSAYKPFHETRIHVETGTGTVIQYQKRIQFNLHLESDPDVDQLKGLRKVLLPLFWYEESYDIDEASLEALHKNIIAPNQMMSIIQWVIIGLGCFIILVGIFVFWYYRSS